MSRAHIKILGSPSAAAKFFSAGNSILDPIEKQALGELEGKTVLHLLCGDGRESLSIGNEGAEHVIGVDFSRPATEWAGDVAKAACIDASFFCIEGFKWLEDEGARSRWLIDTVFLSIGSIWWVPDIKKLFKGIQKVCRKGGRLAIVDFHPVIRMIQDWQICKPYAQGGDVIEWKSGIENYLAFDLETLAPWLESVPTIPRSLASSGPVYEFAWSLSDIVRGLCTSGFRIENICEWTFTIRERWFSDMEESADEYNRFVPPKGIPSCPMSFTCVAVVDNCTRASG